MRTAAELSSGRDLGWFFDEWIHDTGLMDYAVESYGVTQDATGWRTAVSVVRRGELRHPMPVGVRTASGWTVGRASATADDPQVVTVATVERPLEVRLDPFQTTWDWDRRNDAPEDMLITLPDPRFTFNWPYLGPNGSGADAHRALAHGVVQQSAGHRARRARQDELSRDGRSARRRLRLHVAQPARPVHG